MAQNGATVELQPVIGHSVTWPIEIGVDSSAATELGLVDATRERLGTLSFLMIVASRPPSELSPLVEVPRAAVVLFNEDRMLDRSLATLLDRLDTSAVAVVSLLTMSFDRPMILSTDPFSLLSRGPTAALHAPVTLATDRPVVVTRPPRDPCALLVSVALLATPPEVLLTSLVIPRRSPRAPRVRRVVPPSVLPIVRRRVVLVSECSVLVHALNALVRDRTPCRSAASPLATREDREFTLENVVLIRPSTALQVFVVLDSDESTSAEMLVRVLLRSPMLVAFRPSVLPVLDVSDLAELSRWLAESTTPFAVFTRSVQELVRDVVDPSRDETDETRPAVPDMHLSTRGSRVNPSRSDIRLRVIRVRAPVKARLTAAVIADVFRLATRGVTGPTPLPRQHLSLVRPTLGENSATTLVSNRPGTTSVVQHLLERMLLTVALWLMNR